MEQITTAAKVLGAIVLALFAVYAFAVEEMGVIPDYAEVYVEPSRGVYHSPLHRHDNPDRDWTEAARARLGEAKHIGYTADDECAIRGYFLDDRGVVFWAWMEDLGIHIREKRWNLDGSWNY